MVELDDALLAVNGQELARHVLVLIAHDHLDLVTSAGHHRSQVLSCDIDNPEIIFICTLEYFSIAC